MDGKTCHDGRQPGSMDDFVTGATRIDEPFVRFDSVSHGGDAGVGEARSHRRSTKTAG